MSKAGSVKAESTAADAEVAKANSRRSSEAAPKAPAARASSRGGGSSSVRQPPAPPLNAGGVPRPRSAPDSPTFADPAALCVPPPVGPSRRRKRARPAADASEPGAAAAAGVWADWQAGMDDWQAERRGKWWHARRKDEAAGGAQPSMARAENASDAAGEAPRTAAASAAAASAVKPMARAPILQEWSMTADGHFRGRVYGKAGVQDGKWVVTSYVAPEKRDLPAACVWTETGSAYRLGQPAEARGAEPPRPR